MYHFTQTGTVTRVDVPVGTKAAPMNTTVFALATAWGANISGLLIEAALVFGEVDNPPFQVIYAII